MAFCCKRPGSNGRGAFTPFKTEGAQVFYWNAKKHPFQLYKAMPKKGEEEYLYDDKALEKYRKTHDGPFTLQRYKGLGEMDAEQLWETTLNPETRLLKLVEIEDARMASSVTEMLMGTEVPPRRAFIYENATEAELDI